MEAERSDTFVGKPFPGDRQTRRRRKAGSGSLAHPELVEGLMASSEPVARPITVCASYQDDDASSVSGCPDTFIGSLYTDVFAVMNSVRFPVPPQPTFAGGSGTPMNPSSVPSGA
jgi:hypothetical protein